MAGKAVQNKKAEIPSDSEKIAQNIVKIMDRSNELLRKFIEKQPAANNVMTANALSMAEAFTEMTSKLMSDPVEFWKSQLELYRGYVELLEQMSLKAMGERAADVYRPDAKDRRFKDDVWQQNVVFDFIKQSYFLSANWLQQLTHKAGLDEKTAKKMDFYVRQFVDAMAPSNFLVTNPEVLRATVTSNGENLVKGLENLLRDLEKSKGMFQVKTADESAFELGKNIAATRGKVVYQNDLMQLIQYDPQTDRVNKTPLLVVSPWINKYYILDLQEDTSFISWLVKQGHTVFVVSWVNPGKNLASKSFADYMLEGPIAALEAIEKATGEKSASVIGYCIGGTLMACTAAYLKAKGQSERIKSITYLTTLVDFADPGDIGVFIDDAQLEEMEEHMRALGYLDGSEMSAVFSMLRANDMIWSSIINNYMLGKNPLPFDLLFWNADSTRLPAQMHSFYLRNMYKDNLLVKKGGITLGGVKIDLSAISTPTYILSTKEDHIAPWQSTYKATQIYKGPVRFVLSGSGHVAGVVNPPAKKKYCYWTNDKNPATASEWLKNAKENQYSWWEDWNKWILDNKLDGGKVAARKPGDGKLKPLEPAPGSYVKEK